MAFDPNSARPEGSTIARPAFNPATATPAPPEEPGLLRQGADLLLDFAQGGMGVVGAGAAAFGADNVVARGAGEIAKYAAELQSQQRQAERQGQAERMQAAEATGSMWEEAKVAGQNFLETPGAFTASAVGSAVPTMAAAMLGGLPAAAVTGGGIGAGAVKQSIYERIEQEALKAGQTPEQAAAAASAAQAYTGDSADQIALGAGLGLAAGGTGLERVFGGGTSAIKNIVGRVAAGTAAEAVPEAVQGGQERLAANLAAQREGFGGETWTGVVGQGVTEGLASTGPGAVGGLMTPYLDPNAGPISRAAIQAQAQRASVVPGTLQQAAAAAPTEQDAPPESTGNPNRFDPSSAVPAWFGQYEQTNPIATTGTSPAAPTEQSEPQQQEQLRLVPMKNEEAAARRAEVVAKRTGIEQIVIPHPSVPERFAVVPVDSPLASPATPTEQTEGLDVEGLFSTQAPIPLKNARNLAGMLSMAGGVEHAVVPSPAGDGFGVVPVDQLSPAQRGAWAQYQPGARRGAAGRAPGPSAAPTATATPVTPSSTTSNTATPIGTPDAGPELAQVTGATPAAPAVPAVPEGAQGFNTEASRAAPALPQIDSDTLAAAIGNAQTTIRRERWTPEGGSRFEGRVRAELERAGVQKEAAQAVIDLARQQTPTDAFVTSDALVQAARTLGIVPPTSTAAPDTNLRPLDHGELNIPGRTDGIDAELDRWKADQAKAKRAQAKTDAATRREQKAEAKRLFSQFGPAMIERFAPRFGRKEIQNELDSMVKWEPGKFIDLAQRFEREQAAATPPAAPDMRQDIPTSTATPEAAPTLAPQKDTDAPSTPATAPALAPGQTAKGRDVLLAQVEQLKPRTAPADLVQDYNALKDRIADARRRAALKATKRTEATRLTEWADNQERELERLRNAIGFVELKAGTTRYKVLNTPQNLEAFAQKLKKAPVGKWTVTVTPEEIYDNVETRPGTTEAQRERGRSAIAALVDRVNARSVRAGGGSATVLGHRLLESLAGTGGADLVGQKVSSAEDLATLAQIYRDPRFETFRVFYTDAQGAIVGEAAYSSRLPAAVRLPNDFEVRITADMGRFGAAGFWVLHNHPSGRATPSDDDIRLTRTIASNTQGFRGHVVIDFNEYATIDAGGAVQVVQAPQLNGADFFGNPERDHAMLGTLLQGEQDVVKAAKALQVPQGHAALILTRRDGAVQLLMDVPMSMLQAQTSKDLGKLKGALRGFARESGSGGFRFVVLPAGVSPEPFKKLVTTGLITDVVSADGTTAGSFGAFWTGDFLDQNMPIRQVREGDPAPRAQTETAEFKRWFGDSKVVDGDGRPLVVYHGTANDIEQFDPLLLGGNTKAKSAKSAFFFASSPTVASGYAVLGRSRAATRGAQIEAASESDILTPETRSFLKKQLAAPLSEAENAEWSEWFGEVYDIRKGDFIQRGANVLPVHLRIENPLIVDYAGNNYRERSFLNVISQAKEEGRDGVIFRNAEDSMHKDFAEVSDIYAVFSPEQIKSATGNNGNFDPADPSIVREATTPYSLIGTPARTIDELAALAADLPTGTALVVTDGHRIRSVTDVPAALLTDRSKFSRARLRMLARRASREPGQTYLLAPEGTDVKPLRWLVKLEGLRDVVTADATSAAAAIERANRVAEAAPRYSDDFGPERATVKDWIAHQLKQNRGWAMGALTRDQLADIYGDSMPAVEQFDRVVQQMDLVRNRMAEKADALIERWRKLPSKEADRLADVMHAATLAQFDPAEMNATTTDEQQIAADFDALSADARQVYRDVRDQYRDTLIAIRDSLASRAERTGSTGRAIADEIRLKFDRYLQDGPYFSLARFGEFILIADRDGERIVEAFESSLQREKRARGLRAQGFTVKLTAKQQYSATKDGAAGSFIGDVLEKIDALDMDAEQKGALMDQLNQLAISALPDASYRKHFAHRKGTPGFSNDAMRAFASSQLHAGHHLARIRHADELAFLIDEMRADIQATRGDVDTTEQQQVVNELTRRLDLMMNPTTHPVTAALGQVGFVMSLGGSIASGITNLTQTPMVTFPWLGSKFGFDKAAGALLKASKDYFGGRWEKWSGFVLADNPNLIDDERAALRHLEETGLINLTQASDLAGTANTDSTVSKRAFAINRAMKIVGWTFHTPEVFNRQVSALAAYRLARDAGQTHDSAIESARQALIRTHFDYSASNRARFMSGNVTRVITMFKQYSQNVTYLMWRNAYQALKGESAEVRREARRMLLGVAATHFAAAGTMGLPLGIFGVTPLLALFSLGMGDEDDPWDWETEYRNMLADVFGKEGGEAIAKGPIRMLLNIDLASRVGLGDLWIRAPQKEAEGRDLVEAWMITLLGPVAGYAGQMGTAAKAFEEGKFARGVEAMLPKFLASPLKAIRYESEGVRSWKGTDLGITLTEADIVGTALGFNPARVAEMYEGRASVKKREARLQARREELTAMWWEAQQADDRTGVAEALDQIRRFNQRNPSFGITMRTLKQSAMARRRAQLQTSQGYFLSRRRDELRDYGRFAVID